MKVENIEANQSLSEQRRAAKRKEFYAKGTDVIDIMQQRDRIREQIKVVKKQFEADRSAMMSKIKLTNSRD